MLLSQAPQAETCLAFCNIEDHKGIDEEINFEKLTIYVEVRSIPFLKDAEINYDTDNFGGQLTIKSPNSRMQIFQKIAPWKIR